MDPRLPTQCPGVLLQRRGPVPRMPRAQKEYTAFHLENYTRTLGKEIWIKKDWNFYVKYELRNTHKWPVSLNN